MRDAFVLIEFTKPNLAFKRLATLQIWWPKLYDEIQVHGKYCNECVQTGKNLKPWTNQEDSKTPNGRRTKSSKGIGLRRNNVSNLQNKEVHTRLCRLIP